MTSKPQALKAEPSSRGDLQRRKILNALHDCIIAKGYSKTTLRDVARKAGMSASHLLYYFPGKDAILEHYFQKVAEILMQRIEGFREQPPAQQIELLSDLFFAGKGLTRSEIGFMLECFGVAVHDQTLRKLKTELDRNNKAYLKDLFLSLAGENEQFAEDAAEIAYAVLIGLRTAAYFDTQLDLPQARRLFYNSIVNLANRAPRN